jgi:hypothetical protein
MVKAVKAIIISLARLPRKLLFFLHIEIRKA